MKHITLKVNERLNLFDKEEILRATLDVKNLEEIRNTYGSKWQPSNVPQVGLIKAK